MKTIIKNSIMAIAAILMSMSLSAAQNNNGRKINREELAMKQAEHISEALAFDKATSEKFKETYCSFQKEIWALGPSLGKQTSDNSNEKDMEQRFERSQKILDLRKKYFGIYSTFLSQKQISRVYEIEREMMHRLSSPKKNHRNK